jgi:protein-L-isoaspartate O-methyltransferase
MPQALLEQLKPGGRMLLPLGAVSRFQQLVLVEKAADGYGSILLLYSYFPAHLLRPLLL